MSTLPNLIITRPSFELRFAPLGGERVGIAVPCSEDGAVDLDELDDDMRKRYFFAHTLIGRDFARPTVSCIGVEIG